MISETGAEAEEGGLKRLPTLGGDVILNFAARALALLVGLAIAAYLTRILGAVDYGLVVLAITLVSVADWLVGAPMSRASLKLVSESATPDEAARTVNRVHVWGGLVGSALTVLLALPLSETLQRPELAPLLLILAAEPVLTLSAQGLQRIWFGKGRYRIGARGTMLRSVGRLALVLLLVGGAGLSTAGAVAAYAGAAALELLYLGLRRPFPPRGPQLPIRRVVAFAAPLSLVALAMRLHHTVDIFLLQALSRDDVVVGLYGAAHQVILIPLLVSWSIGPILLSTLGRLNRDGERKTSKLVAETALRASFVCLPLAAVGAGAATEVATLTFGPDFAAAGPLMAVLLPGGVATLLLAFSMTILVAEDHLGLTAVLAVPIPILSILGMVIGIPRFGAMAAAWSTAGAMALGAVTALIVLEARYPGVVPRRSLLRSLALAPGMYLLALAPTPGPLVVVKLVALCGVVGAVLLALGEWKELERGLRVMGWPELRSAPPPPRGR